MYHTQTKLRNVPLERKKEEVWQIRLCELRETRAEAMLLARSKMDARVNLDRPEGTCCRHWSSEPMLDTGLMKRVDSHTGRRSLLGFSDDRVDRSRVSDRHHRCASWHTTSSFAPVSMVILQLTMYPSLLDIEAKSYFSFPSGEVD